MTTSIVGARGRSGRTAGIFVLSVIVACLGGFTLAGSAKAEPFSMELTNGEINLGTSFFDEEVLPAPAQSQILAPPNPISPLPDLWDARDTVSMVNTSSTLPWGCLSPSLLDITTSPSVDVGPNPEAPCESNPATATVSGDMTGNAVTIEGSADGGFGDIPGTSPPTSFGLPSGFRFPILMVPNPLGGTEIPISMASTDDLSGTYDPDSGALSLDGPMEARVLTGLGFNPLGSYCALPLVGLTLSTESNSDFPGVPFTSGIEGDGALTGTYNVADDATSVGGANCGAVNQVSKGPGSIWLSSGIEAPPECPEFTTGVPPNCDPVPCPEGFTGNEPDCTEVVAEPAEVAKIGTVKVKGPGKVKKGKKGKYTVRIKNTGTATATGVKIKVSGKGVKSKKKVGSINAGATKKLKVKVKFKKPGKVKTTWKVTSGNAGGKTVKKKVKVKK